MRIGIMGGTFDPIHYGHLLTAEEAKEQFHLDRVIFVPSGMPPHKKKRVVSAAEHRCKMVAAAIATNPQFSLSRVEVERKGFSYAADTVDAFLEIYGKDTELYFITGADAIREIMSWHKVQDLIKKCQFIAATRPGYNYATVFQLPPPYKGRIHPLNVTAVAISSSQIRELKRENKSIKYLLPEAVETYIAEKGLYKND